MTLRQTRPPSCPRKYCFGANRGGTRPGVSSGVESSRKLLAGDRAKRVEAGGAVNHELSEKHESGEFEREHDEYGHRVAMS